MTLQLAVLVTYAALLMGFGLWAGRRSRSAGDFFVAGRRLGPLLLFSTILASNIGAGSTVNAAALGYRDGLSAWWWVGSAGLGSIVLALWIGPHVRRIAARHQLETVGDLLEYRYGPGVRAAVAALLWIGTLAILAGQLLAIGWVLNVVTGMDRWAGCMLGGLVVTVYFTAGGLLTAVWVNVVQLAVLLAGFAVVLPLALAEAGGLGQVMAATSDLEGYWNPWRGGGSGWFYVAMLAPAFIVSPGLLQKVYGARDDAAVRAGVGLNAAVLLLFAAGPPLLGMIARAAHPDLANQDLALPILLMETVPPVVGALGLAALFSRGGELGRRDPVHAGHVPLARPVQAVRAACRQRHGGAARRAAGGGRRRRAGNGARGGRRVDRRGADVLLYAAEREPVRPRDCRPVLATGRLGRGARRHGWRRRAGHARTGGDRRRRLRRHDAGDVGPGRLSTRRRRRGDRTAPTAPTGRQAPGWIVSRLEI